MKILVSPTVEAQAMQAAQIVAQVVAQRPQALLCLAAGETPTETYRQMVRLQDRGEADFTRCRLVGLDEWVGMDETTEGGCKHYIWENVVAPLGILPENITFFDACAADLQQECHRLDAYLAQHGPIDISLMGVGMNGHIGLNEPGCDLEGTAHVAALDPLTARVAQKYFATPTKVVRGITLGMGQIWASRLLLVMANGKRKRDVMHNALQGEITADIPASAVQRHPNCIVSLDEAAFSGFHYT